MRLALALLLVVAACGGLHAQDNPPVRLTDYKVGQTVRLAADHPDGAATVMYLVTENGQPVSQWQPLDVWRDWQILLPVTLTAPGRREFRITAEGANGARATSAAAVITVGAPCLYAPPGTTATTERPTGSIIHGYNALDPNSAADRQKQAERIWQMLVWGWRQLIAFPDIPNKKILLVFACEGR